MKNQRKLTLIAVLIIVGLLWGFYIIQEEFATYGIYELISYRVHEMSSVLRAFCPLVTIGCAVYLLVRLIKRDCDIIEKILLVVFVLCFAAQASYFDRSVVTSRIVVCTVEEINEQDGTIIISPIDDKADAITLECPAFFRDLLVEKVHSYAVTYERSRNNPNEGEVTMIKLSEPWHILPG